MSDYRIVDINEVKKKIDEMVEVGYGFIRENSLQAQDIADLQSQLDTLRKERDKLRDRCSELFDRVKELEAKHTLIINCTGCGLETVTNCEDEQQ